MFYSNPQRESSHSSSSPAFFGEQQSSSSFFTPVVQPKLNVNSPGDKYEQEADAMADRVTSMPEKTGAMSASHNAAPAVQRKCAKCEEEEKKQNVMRKAMNDGGFQAPPHFESKLADTKGGGSPMAADTRSFMENAFQTDLSHVRIHNNAAATSMNSTIQAKAFTFGSDIYFNSGQYNPESKEGKHLLAHELTHTQQQGKTGASLQRQPADGGTAVPFEKYGESVESSYRQAGLVKEANAVQYCRVWGECGKVLTEHEAYEMYRSGRITAGLEQQPGAGQQANAGSGGVSQGNAGGGGVSQANAGVAGAPLAVGALRATASTAVEGAAQSGTTTALEQAAVRWGTASVMEGGATAAATEGTATLTVIEGGLGTTATVAEGTATAAAPAAGAGVATVAIPVAIGVVVVVAAVDLFSYASFQAKLQSLGFTILPSPLGVCIANCHQPKAPLTNKWSQPSPWMTSDTFPQPWTQQNPFQPQSNPWGPITSWRGPLKPLKPATPTTTPAKPATPATPTTTPVKPAGPGTKPATPAKPATPVKPATPAMPKTTPAKPAKPATPTTTPKPAAPTTKPAKPAAPDTKPATPAAPTKRTSPDKRTKKKPSPKPGEVNYPIPFPHTSPWSDEDDDTSRKCRAEWIEPKFGRYPCHSDYAKLFSGTRLEYRVTTPQGLSADFDAVRGDVLIEVKTGYEWMLNRNLGPDMQERRRQTMDRFMEQSIRQVLIGMECDYDVLWYFNSRPLAEMMAMELPHVEVRWRPFNCDTDSDGTW